MAMRLFGNESGRPMVENEMIALRQIAKKVDKARREIRDVNSRNPPENIDIRRVSKNR